jgi:transcriptional regulator with XRE-family HTH domain
MTMDSLIATRLLQLRQAKSLSLVQLAQLSGVSKASISKIERQDMSPSASILGRLAGALGISLAELFAEEPVPPQRLSKHADQPVWRDPEAGYLRRQVASRDAGLRFEMVEVEMPRCAQVSYPKWSGHPYAQRLWLLDGALRVDYGDESFTLGIGDCLDFGVDRPVTFKALGRSACRYLLVIAAEPG